MTQIGSHSSERYSTTVQTVQHHLDSSKFGTDAAEFCFKLMAQSRFSPFHILFLK